jgi:hypothetical protein
MELDLTDFEAEAYGAHFAALRVDMPGLAEGAVPATAAADLFKTSLLPSVTLKEVRDTHAPGTAPLTDVVSALVGTGPVDLGLGAAARREHVCTSRVLCGAAADRACPGQEGPLPRARRHPYVRARPALPLLACARP